jgi:hypothetical protein
MSLKKLKTPGLARDSARFWMGRALVIGCICFELGVAMAG